MANNYLTTGVYYRGNLYNITGQIYKQSQNYSTALLYFNNIPYYLQLFVDETYIDGWITLNYIKGFEVYTRNLTKPPAVGSVTNIANANNVAVWQGEDSNSIIRWTTRANIIKGISYLRFNQCEIYDSSTNGLTLGTWNINNALNNLQFENNNTSITLFNTSPALLSHVGSRTDYLNNGRIIDRSGNWLNINYVYFNTKYDYYISFNNRINNRLLTFTGIAERVSIEFNQYQYVNIYSLSLNNVQSSVKLSFNNQFYFNNRHILYIFNSNINSMMLYDFNNGGTSSYFDRQVEITIKNSSVHIEDLFSGSRSPLTRSEIFGSTVSLNLTNSNVRILGMSIYNVGFLGYSPKDHTFSENYNLNLIRNPSTWSNFSSFNLIIDNNSRFISRTPTIYLGLNNSITRLLQQSYASMTSVGVKWKGIYWNNSINWIDAVLNYNMIVPLMAVSNNLGASENSFTLGTLNPSVFSNISSAFDYEFSETEEDYEEDHPINAIITAVWTGSVTGGGSNSNFLILNPHAPITNVPWYHTSRFTFLQMIGGRSARGWSVMFNSLSDTSTSLNTPFTLMITNKAGTFIDQRAYDGSIPTNYMMGKFSPPYITNLYITGADSYSNRKSPVFSGIDLTGWYNIVVNDSITYAFRNCGIYAPIIINRCIYNPSFIGPTTNTPYYKLFDNCFFANAVRLNIEGFNQVISGALTQGYNNDLPLAVLNSWSIISPGNKYIYLRNNNSSLNIFQWLVNKGYNAARIYKF